MGVENRHTILMILNLLQTPLKQYFRHRDALDAPGEKRTELLCTVRGILKKIKQSVLVGDRVRVAGIDWDDQRGVHAVLCPSVGIDGLVAMTADECLHVV